jgi:hypothetical protein
MTEACDTTLRDLVLKRLEADTQPEDEWSALVLAPSAVTGGEESAVSTPTPQQARTLAMAQRPATDVAERAT